jgi:hypothetical protein
VAKTILSWFQRPGGQEGGQWPSRSKSIATNSSTRTRRQSIVTSMRFDKLPSNWVNWRLQERFQSPYVPESRITGNAEAGLSRDSLESCPTSAIRCELLTRQRPQLHTQVHLPWYSWAERSCKVHPRMIRADLPDKHDSDLAAPPMAVLIAITSMGLSTLRMMICVYRYSYWSLTRLYTVSGYAMIQLWLLISFVYWWAEFRKWSSDHRSCGSSVREA